MNRGPVVLNCIITDHNGVFGSLALEMLSDFCLRRFSLRGQKSFWSLNVLTHLIVLEDFYNKNKFHPHILLPDAHICRVILSNFRAILSFNPSNYICGTQSLSSLCLEMYHHVMVLGHIQVQCWLQDYTLLSTYLWLWKIWNRFLSSDSIFKMPSVILRIFWHIEY